MVVEDKTEGTSCTTDGFIASEIFLTILEGSCVEEVAYSTRKARSWVGFRASFTRFETFLSTGQIGSKVEVIEALEAAIRLAREAIRSTAQTFAGIGVKISSFQAFQAKSR